MNIFNLWMNRLSKLYLKRALKDLKNGFKFYNKEI
jgi:hypothetical protein